MTFIPPWKRAIPHSRDLLPLLGLRPGQHLPEHGLSTQRINGVQVWIQPKDQTSKAVRPHRILACCPDCEWVGSAGRLFQHKCNPKRPRKAKS